MPTKIQLRRDSEIGVAAAPEVILSSGEPFVLNGNSLAIGDGSTTLVDLPAYAPNSHCSVLTSNKTFGTEQTETIFGGALNVYAGNVYEIEYQLVGTFASNGTNLTVSVDNLIAAGTVSFGRYINEWTCHVNINTTNYANLSFYGSISSDSTAPIVKDADSDWQEAAVIHLAGQASGNYFFTYKIKGILVMSTSGTFNPRFAFSSTSHLSSLTLTAGSYIKATVLGTTNTITRKGDWT
jgi:hypothetical protein